MSERSIKEWGLHFHRRMHGAAGTKDVDTYALKRNGEHLAILMVPVAQYRTFNVAEHILGTLNNQPVMDVKEVAAEALEISAMFHGPWRIDKETSFLPITRADARKIKNLIFHVCAEWAATQHANEILRADYAKMHKLVDALQQELLSTRGRVDAVDMRDPNVADMLDADSVEDDVAQLEIPDMACRKDLLHR